MQLHGWRENRQKFAVRTVHKTFARKDTLPFNKHHYVPYDGRTFHQARVAKDFSPVEASFGDGC